ncbi:MAG: Na+/H+ antiporter subunit E [Rubrivivax sp.]
MKPHNGWGRWLPYPVVSVLIGTTWLLLQGSLSAANCLSAIVFALLLPLALRGFLGDAWPRRGAVAALRLLVVLLWDIVTANLNVAWLVLWPWSRPRPAWLVVPLELRSPRAKALLASIISITPGTVSCVIDEERALILVHALDCADPQAAVNGIKARYEQPLLEIFE